MEIEGTNLFITNDEFGKDEPCDGCGENMRDDPHITGIESCCGGCYRRICFHCVEAMAAKIKEFKDDKSNVDRDDNGNWMHDSSDSSGDKG